MPNINCDDLTDEQRLHFRKYQQSQHANQPNAPQMNPQPPVLQATDQTLHQQQMAQQQQYYESQIQQQNQHNQQQMQQVQQQMQQQVTRPPPTNQLIMQPQSHAPYMSLKNYSDYELNDPRRYAELAKQAVVAREAKAVDQTLTHMFGVAPPPNLYQPTGSGQKFQQKFGGQSQQSSQLLLNDGSVLNAATSRPRDQPSSLSARANSLNALYGRQNFDDVLNNAAPGNKSPTNQR